MLLPFLITLPLLFLAFLAIIILLDLLALEDLEDFPVLLPLPLPLLPLPALPTFPLQAFLLLKSATELTRASMTPRMIMICSLVCPMPNLP